MEILESLKIILRVIFVSMNQMNFKTIIGVEYSITLLASWHGYNWNIFDLMDLIEIKLACDQ